MAGGRGSSFQVSRSFSACRTKILSYNSSLLFTVSGGLFAAGLVLALLYRDEMLPYGESREVARGKEEGSSLL